ncbi:MAG: hypothetical protein KY454_08115 [Actinobacteria bacterium]|nr:hypothetical protein [Actinomycetota bacterium]MBW3649237.1 hypothetical protein [Actinomycetota bacterium]
MQSTRRWLNQSQPQTLVIATWLLYANAAFAVLDLLRAGVLISLRPLVLLYFAVRIGGGVLGGRGIANEQKWGYYLGLASAIAPFVLRAVITGNPFAADIISLAFEIALVALLLHPMSRDYQRIWFK